METHPKKQHGDTPPSACLQDPPRSGPKSKDDQSGEPPELQETCTHPPFEAQQRQDGQGGIQERSGYQKCPQKPFTPSSGRNKLGLFQGCEQPNYFQRRNRIKYYSTFREVKRHQLGQQPECPQDSQVPPRSLAALGQQPEHPQDSQVPPRSLAAASLSTEDWKEEAEKNPDVAQSPGQQVEHQQGKKHIGTRHEKGQRQWRGRGSRSQQQPQYVWLPVKQDDLRMQRHEQLQQQQHHREQQHERQQQKQCDLQQQRGTQQQDVQRKCSQQQQRQQAKQQHDYRQLRRQQVQGQQEQKPKQQQQKQEQQQKQQEEQQQQQQRQKQQPVSSRPACVRPQLAGGAFPVVMELQRLQCQFSSSFSLVACHPLLLPLMQRQQCSASKDGSFPLRANSLIPGSSRPAAAAQTVMRQSSDTDWAMPGAPASAAATLGVSNGSQGNCRVSCEPKAATGGQELATCQPEAASSILCEFELLLVPTDPDFDANMLPCGLRLRVTMGKTYPGAEAVFKDLTGLNGSLSDAAAGKDAANAAAHAAAVSEGSMSIPEPGRAPNHWLDSGPSGQQVAAAAAPTIKLHPTEGCVGAAFNASSQGRTVAAVKGLNQGPSPSVAVLKVCNEEVNDLRRDAIELVFSKVIEQQLANNEKTDLVRTAIKALDRHMRRIFEVEWTPPDAAPQKVELPWTEEEQKRLEEAVVLYRRVAEPTLRWRNISSHVGSRTAKECAIRFQLCRENVLRQHQRAAVEDVTNVNKRDKVEELYDSSNEAVLDSKRQDGEAQLATEEGGSQAFRGSDVSLIDSTTEGVSSLHLSCIQLQVTCGRCRAVVDLRVSLPKDGTTLEPAGCSVGCAKCQLRMSIKVQPTIGVAGSQLMRVAIVQPTDCCLKDLLPCDFVLACDCCGASMKAREVQSGSPRTNHCRHCHSKIIFGFQGAALGLTVVCGLSTTDSRSRPSCSSQQRQRKQDLRIVVGSPLADFGTCKHYRKSFRWLRFPCCGKAYPCDVCHDSTEDHEHEWATRMICGFCSTEQPFANGKPCTCGKALTKGGGTAHWEGGKGCRDRTRMSRKDSRKYKSLNKQQHTS